MTRALATGGMGRLALSGPCARRQRIAAPPAAGDDGAAPEDQPAIGQPEQSERAQNNARNRSRSKMLASTRILPDAQAAANSSCPLVSPIRSSLFIASRIWA